MLIFEDSQSGLQKQLQILPWLVLLIHLKIKLMLDPLVVAKFLKFSLYLPAIRIQYFLLVRTVLVPRERHKLLLVLMLLSWKHIIIKYKIIIHRLSLQHHLSHSSLGVMYSSNFSKPSRSAYIPTITSAVQWIIWSLASSSERLMMFNWL